MSTITTDPCPLCAAPPRPTSPGPLAVTVSDMARMLSISRARAYQLLDEQIIESRFIGRRRLIPVASIEAFLHSLPTERERP